MRRTLAGATGTGGAAGGMPARGWLPVTVPGAPAGWRDLQRGSVGCASQSCSRTRSPTRSRLPGVADGGAPLAARGGGARGLARAEFAGWAEVFAPGGRAPRAGELWRNPDAARTLRLIAATGADAFYRGRDRRGGSWTCRRGPAGLLTGADLATHASLWVDPISAGYRGHEVWEIPPNGQGIAALLALAILDGVDLAAAPVASGCTCRSRR